MKLDEEIEQEIRGTRPYSVFYDGKADYFQNFRRRNERVSLQHPSSSTLWNSHQRSSNELLMMGMIISVIILLARNPEGKTAGHF